MGVLKAVRRISLPIVTALPIIVTHPVFAAATGSGAGGSADATAAPVDNFLKNISTLLASLGGSVAMLALIVGGIMYIVAAGDLQKLDRAKSILKGAVIGLVIVIAAAFVTNLMSGQAHSAFGG